MRRLLPVVLVSLVTLSAASSSHAQKRNKSLKLNTPALANQYLVAGDQTGLEGDTDAGYTIEAWVYPSSYVSYPTIVGNDYQNGFWFGLEAGTGELRFWPLGLDQGTVLTGVTPIPLNQWTHVAASYQVISHTARLFINGVQDVSSAGFAGIPDASDAPFCIGADRPANGAPNFFWRGWIDEVKFWNSARGSISLSNQRFHRPGTPRMIGFGDYSGLTAYWDMEDPIAGVFQDRWAGNGQAANNASPVGGWSLSTTVVPPIAYNHGLFFGGADYVYRDLPPDFSFSAGLTIEAWVAPAYLALQPAEGVLLPYRTIVSRGVDESFHLGLTPDNRLRFYPSGGFGEFFEGNWSLPLNDWTHVAAVYRPGLAEIYVNGVRDEFSTAFTASPIENGIMPLIGADPPIMLGPGAAASLDRDATMGISGQLPYFGWMDEVRVTGAPLSATTIREGMFRSAPPVELVADELGVPRTRVTASLDPHGPEAIFAPTMARFERSGAPLFGPEAELASASIFGYRNEIPGQVGSLPGGADYTSIQRDLFVAQNFTLNDVNAFVSLSATSTVPNAAAKALEQVKVELQHPGLTVTLMNYGDGRGRDLHTVFDDEAPLALSAATTPYVDGARPVQTLANLDGLPSSGTWHLNVTCINNVEACVWAWGVSFNDINPLDVPGSPRPGELSLGGTNPVRGQGALTFRLPADGAVKLRLLDVAGREVRTLLDGPFVAGEHRVSWEARDLAPGLYFLALERSGGEARRMKVAVVR